MAVASQKITRPGETGEPPRVAVAVSVTGVPLVTVLSDKANAVCRVGEALSGTVLDRLEL